MWVDIGVLVLLVVFTLLGYARGLFSQAWSLAALVASFIGAQPAFDLLAPRFGWGTRDSFLGDWVIKIVLGIILYVLLLVLGYILEKRLIERFKLVSAGNRVFGAGLGLVKGVVGVVIALWLLTFVTHLMPQRQTPWRAQLEASTSADLVARYNPLNLFLLARVKPYLPKKVTGSARDPVTPPKAVAERSSFKALLADEAFLEAYREREYLKILLNPAFQRLVADTSLLAALEKSQH